MTREAKIGLLLGLCFIVAIAVVLRDVHQVDRNEPWMDTQNATDEQWSEVVDVPLAVSQLSSTEPWRETAERSESSTSIAETIETAEEVPGQVEEIRYKMDLPGSPQNSQAETGHSQGAQWDVPSEPSEQFDRLIETLESAQPSRPLVVKPQKKTSQRTYTVRKGDDLSKIAVKMYGPAEGNRWVNVIGIYKANRKTLPTEHDLKVGQKLTIPAIKGVGFRSGGAEMTSSVVQNANKNSGKKKTGSISRGDYLHYKVRQGDSLWKIAQAKLGNGNRFIEIAKLNDRLLSDENSLKPGMKLKLPKK